MTRSNRRSPARLKSNLHGFGLLFQVDDFIAE